MMKTCIFRQPAGLGDIFFCQKMAKMVLNSGRADRLIWPVIKEYTYLKNYLLVDNISFVNEEESFPFKSVYDEDPQKLIDVPDLLYLPIQHADRFISDQPVMQRKYVFMNMSYADWVNFFVYKRDIEREKTLETYLGLVEGEPFNLINRNFGSKNYTYLNNKIAIELNNGFKNIVMEYLDFDNIFDWVGLMERAWEIHTVDTEIGRASCRERV